MFSFFAFLLRKNSPFLCISYLFTYIFLLFHLLLILYIFSRVYILGFSIFPFGTYLDAFCEIEISTFFSLK